MNTEQDLRATIAWLERRIAELERASAAQPAAATDPAATKVDAPSRRGLMRLGAVGVAGAAVAAVSRPGTAAAACGSPLYAGCNNPVTDTTILTNQSPVGYVLGVVYPNRTYATLAGQTEAVHGVGNAVVGVRGDSVGPAGVRGVRLGTDVTPSGTAGVLGEHYNADESGTGVIGRHHAAGWGMWASSVSGKGLHADGGTGTGAEAVTTGTVADTSGLVGRITAKSPATGTAAIRAVTASTTSESVAVRARHAGSGIAVEATAVSGTGVRGAGGTGRGGVFSGSTAQISLDPGTRSTHPTAGTRGDLYVDKTGRLWFCKTTGDPGTWTQVV